MRIVFVSRPVNTGGGTAPRPEPVANIGLATIDGGNAATQYNDSYDNGMATNPTPEVTFDFGRSV